jgi:hypothetical protein
MAASAEREGEFISRNVAAVALAFSVRNVKPATSAASGLKTRWVLVAERHHLGLVERQFIAQRFGALHSAKAATDDDDTFRAHPWKGNKLTSTGKLVTTEKLAVRRALRWI